MSDDKDLMSFKDAVREINRFSKFMEAAKSISDVLSACVRAENDAVAFQKMAVDLKAECVNLVEKRDTLHAEIEQHRTDYKIRLDASEKHASGQKATWREQVEETKQRSHSIIQKLEKDLADRQRVLKKERSDLEAGTKALRVSVKEDIEQLEQQRADAERTITGLKTRLSQAVG